ncbi:MAG TPA: beta-1,3-glucanase family protein [Candidatus Baltobacteraceae bacterium]|jgi:hypothetical protein|nr:beta-1,3-glucanase family protein [Candidatus Baltobacteraceae bacterium]
MDSNRRIFLASLASSAALAACSGGKLLPGADSPASGDAARRHPFAKSGGPGTATLEFKTNNTNVDLKNVWFAYYGQDPSNGNKQSHLVDAKGTLALSKPSGGKPTTSLAINCATGPTFVIPQLVAGRLYVSVGGPLAFVVDPNGFPIPPVSFSSTDPNYKLMWDFFELTYQPQAGTTGLFNFNLSTVQSANLPVQFHLVGEDPSSKAPVDVRRGWEPGGYTKFLDKMRGNPDFDALVLAGTNRVLQPGTALKAYAQKQIPKALFSATYYDDYVSQVWSKFEKTELKFVGDPPPNSDTFVNFTGQVNDQGQFVFTTKSTQVTLNPIVLGKPSSEQLFENDFGFCASGCGKSGGNQLNYANQIMGTLCAALNRSVMLDVTTLATGATSAWCQDVASFYKDPTTNHYAKQVHANSLAGRAYAFQSDDHCDVSSFESLINVSTFTISFTTT